VDVGSFPFGDFEFGAGGVTDKGDNGVVRVTGDVLEEGKLLWILVSILEVEKKITDSNASRGAGDKIRRHGFLEL
jgi:hypothetical protein